VYHSRRRSQNSCTFPFAEVPLNPASLPSSRFSRPSRIHDDLQRRICKPHTISNHRPGRGGFLRLAESTPPARH